MVWRPGSLLQTEAPLLNVSGLRLRGGRLSPAGAGPFEQLLTAGAAVGEPRTGAHLRFHLPIGMQSASLANPVVQEADTVDSLSPLIALGGTTLRNFQLPQRRTAPKKVSERFLGS